MSDKIISIRLNAEELDTITKAAGDDTIPRYIKRRALDETVQTPQEVRWAKIGSLLNLDQFFAQLERKSPENPTLGDQCYYTWGFILQDLLIASQARPSYQDDPSLWKIKTNPDGEDAPWINEDNETILVLVNARGQEKMLYKGEPWFDLFTNQ